MNDKRRKQLRKIKQELSAFRNSIPPYGTQLGSEKAKQINDICDTLSVIAEENHDAYTALEDSNLKYRSDFMITEECDDHLQDAYDLLCNAIDEDEAGSTLAQSIFKILFHITYAIAK